MRPYTSRMTPPFTMIGGAVGVVEQSKNPEFPVGCTIIHTAGWVERGVVNPDKMGKASPNGKLEQESPTGCLRNAGEHSVLRTN